MIEWDAEQFDQIVVQQRWPALIECWAPWWIYCLLLKPKIEALAQSRGDQIAVGRLNVDKHPALAAALDIECVPALVLFAGGRLARKWYGDLMLREITDALDEFKVLRSPDNDGA
jgi:thioredoxin-like negative regulator of GroEL